MPDIDPAALKRPGSIQTSLDPSSLTLTKLNVATSKDAPPKASKAAHNGPQRIDVEPIYTSLKSAIGDRWGEYKEAVGLFAIGFINQSELSLRIDHFILASPETEHLHNSLITAILANVYREPPEPGVAPWVSASDKPLTGIGTTAAGKGGDKVEERLRKEIMSLPGKDRKRLKGIVERDAIDTSTTSAMTDYRLARTLKLPDVIPASAGGLSKTNWDIEIRKRYANPLSFETLEFPDAANVQNRMLPICYEEALPSGAADHCAEFVATAAEMLIKEVVGSVYAITRNSSISAIQPATSDTSLVTTTTTTNGTTVRSKTGGLRQSSGNVSRSLSGTLGSMALQKRPLGIGDFRLALSVSSCSLGTMPDIVHEIIGGWPEGILEGWDGSLTSSMNGKGYKILPSVELSPDIAPPALPNGAVQPATPPHRISTPEQQTSSFTMNGISSSIPASGASMKRTASLNSKALTADAPYTNGTMSSATPTVNGNHNNVITPYPFGDVGKESGIFTFLKPTTTTAATATKTEPATDEENGILDFRPYFDEPDAEGWVGSSASDREGLWGVLDDCLAGH